MSISSIKFRNIQKAVYGYLSEHLDIPIEEIIDEGTPMPYVAMGQLSSRNENTRTFDGLEITQELHIYSDFQGKDEVIDIVDDIRELVAEHDLNIEGADVVYRETDNISISSSNIAYYEGNLYLTIKLFD